MSFINRHSKEIFCKIIYTGIPQSGKTTNLQWIYKSTASQKEDSHIMSLPIQSDETTFFNFLPISTGKIKEFSTRLHLYTIPGTHLFKSTSRIILKGVDGIVFVVDSDPLKLDENIKHVNQLKDQLSNEGYDLKKIPLVIQYNKRDLGNALPLFQLRTSLNHYNSPDIEAVATTGKGVVDTLKLISKIVVNVLKGGDLQ